MTDSKTQQFNDAQWTAWAYINEVRHVKPKTGDAYYSISLSGLQGTKETPIYLRIRSGNVYGEQAIAMAASLYDLSEDAKRNNQKLKIFAYVKLSDLTPSIYYAGDEPRVSMMGRLFSITNVQIDGVKKLAELNAIPGQEDDAHDPVKEDKPSEPVIEPVTDLYKQVSYGATIEMGGTNYL